MCSDQPKELSTKNSLIPLFPDADILYKALDYYQPDIVHFCETLTDIHGHKIDIDPFLQLQTEVKRKIPRNQHHAFNPHSTKQHPAGLPSP